MALQAEIIPFALRTGTGSQTINHVRYPSIAAKGLVLVCASNSGTNSQIYGVGFDDGSTHIGTSIGSSANPFGSDVLTARGYTTTYSLVTTQSQAFFGGADTRMLGYVSAINVGSFDITLDLNNTPGANWFAIMLGGDGVECKVGIAQKNAAPISVTVGFEPAALLKLSSPNAGTNGFVSGADHHYGFASVCDTVQAGWGIDCTWGGNRSSSYQLADKLQADITAGSTTVSDFATLDSWAADGFVVSDPLAALWNIGYLAIGGPAVSANLVSLNQPTSTGVQTTAITATDPVIAFFGSTNKVTTVGAGNADANFTFGVYDGSSNMSQWWGTVDQLPRRFHRRSATSECLILATGTGVATSTVNAAATCTLASTELNLNWSQVDSTQREIWALVLGQNLTGSSNPCGANPQASITVIKQTAPFPGGDTEFPFGATGGLSPSTFTLVDGGSQLFSSVSAGTYGITESAPSGWTASYVVSNDDPHDAIVISGTEAVTVTVTNTFQSTTAQLRRLRRFALPYDGNKRIFIPRIEIIAQMGVGNADDADPVMSLRISPDGGQTWGPYRELPLGASGETMIRAYLTRFCQGLRNPVAELICDAPVFVAWVACELPQGSTVGSS